jgi:predicted Fe-Mo cluster-binding NifX family protein
MGSELDPRLGWAGYFVVVDTDSGSFFAHENERARQAARGAGVEAARQILGLGVEAVVTGNVGPNAAAALRAGNVTVHRQNWGTVRDAIEQVKGGQLPELGDVKTTTRNVAYGMEAR